MQVYIVVLNDTSQKKEIRRKTNEQTREERERKRIVKVCFFFLSTIVSPCWVSHDDGKLFSSLSPSLTS